MRRCIEVVVVCASVAAFSGLVQAQTIPLAGRFPTVRDDGSACQASDTIQRNASGVFRCAAPAASGQPLDSDLTSIAALTSAADKCLTATGAGVWALVDCPAFGRSLLDDTSAANARATLGAASAPLTATTASIGGGALLAGACATVTVSVPGATTAMAAYASPLGGVDPSNGGVLGVAIGARVSSADTVTVTVCAPVAGTPTAATYRVVVQ